MRFISTNSSASPVGLDDAVNRCVASDGGMFMPEYMPVIPQAFFKNISGMSLREIAYVVATSFLGEDVEPAVLKNIVDVSFSFDAPLVRICTDVYILELFNGPTLTVKDYGARFMARLMGHLDGRASRRRNILVATTGNTGAAAANGLYKLDGMIVSVLYPKGQLTRAQASQITALGENIHAVEVMGSVEDCKRLVQDAIAEPGLSGYNLTGANSINIARLIPQVTFALHAYARLKAMGVKNAEQAIYSIPAGNLSNVVAAAMARSIGLPMGPILAAVNANDQVAPCMAGNFTTDRSRRPVRTLAPSIDMSVPSGWPRLAHLYGGDLAAIARDVVATPPISDDMIRTTVCDLRSRSGYTIDPHGAVAYATVQQYAAPPGTPKVVFATGHPAKQLDIMTRITGHTVELPLQLTHFMTVRRHPSLLAPTLPALRKHLQSIQ